MINYDVFKRLGLKTKKDIDTVVQEYKSLGLKWDVESMIFMNDNNITTMDVYNGDSFKALLVIIQSGLPSHDVVDAKKIFDHWQNLGYGFRVLRALCINDIEDAGFFLGEAEKILLDGLQRKSVGDSFILMETLNLVNTTIELRKRGKYLTD